MISCSSIWAMILRHARMWNRDPNFLLGTFYWPLLDIFIWGFLGSWIQQSQTTSLHDYTTIALLGILLWQFIGRGCNVMIMGFVEELWSHNIVNLFSLPLRLIEWIISIILFTMIMMAIKTVFSLLVIYYLYDVSMLSFVSTFLTFFPPLFICGVWIGFICLSVIVLLGKRGVELGYVFAWMLLPFSGAYYPIDVLPGWAQNIGLWLPMHHVFLAMRRFVMYHEDPTAHLMKGYSLSTLYALGAIALFMYCFQKARHKGLARLIE